MRVVGVGLSVAAGLAAGGLTAHTLRVRRATEAPPSIERAAAMRAFEGERAVAAGLRMTLAEEGDAPVEKQGAVGGTWSRRVQVGARECVAVIATTYGNHAPVALALQSLSDDDTRIAAGMTRPLSLTRADGGLVAQAQWCDAEAHPRVAVFETRALTERVFDRPLTAAVHFAIYRAPWEVVGGPARLLRGELGGWAMRQMPPRFALDESAAHLPAGGQLVGVPVPVRPDGARLLPANADTYRVLYERVRGASDAVVNPRIDPSRPAGDPWGTGLPVDLLGVYRALRGEREGPRLHDPVFEVAGARRRVLAVVDTRRLGAPCVTLMLTRVLYGHEAVVWRHGATPGDPGVRLPARENSVLDRHCLADAVVVYSVDDCDQEEWVLRVFAHAPPEAPAAPIAVPAVEAPPEAPRRHGHRRHGR